MEALLHSFLTSAVNGVGGDVNSWSYRFWRSRITMHFKLLCIILLSVSGVQ